MQPFLGGWSRFQTYLAFLGGCICPLSGLGARALAVAGGPSNLVLAGFVLVSFLILLGNQSRETGDLDIILSPPEWTRAKTDGADQWVLKQRELPGFAIVNEKKRPHPWDTHHQFSIKTLLSK